MASCSDFLDIKPKGVITNEEINNPQLLDNMVLSAYAIWVTGDDINSSFSLVNFDLRSDDCYKGGKGPEDGDVFHSLEVCYGTSTEDWNINGMWERLYKNITRANSALKSLSGVSDEVATKKVRTAEMRFLRGHAHFLLKELFKNIVIVNNENLTDEEYSNLSNFTFTNDEQWQKIIEDFQYAYENLPEKQKEVGRPSKAAAAAYLAKAYLYKAYRQDDATSNRITEINVKDLEEVIKYTNQQIYTDGGFDLEDDFSNNFIPEMENGKESLWAYQYSMNDGTLSGQLNFGKGLSAPWFKINAHDFHKPSQNLINAYRTDASGHPMFDDYNKQNYDAMTDNVDPRLFHTAS
ncbi:MAG: RagB/SusD family nutrient uptake outer membrane protein, partial [Bacteroidaceae bacterium]|nr:RagB/SusD family nutrient uptake outer membrane protein [Bacteroidaceae bacterium]